MHEAVIQLIAIALENWDSYDSWALSRGFDPLEIPSRRFINSVWAWLTENMEDEGKNTLIDILFQAGYSKPKQRHLKAVAEETETEEVVKYDPKSRWRAPEGWTPPGWLPDEVAFNNAVGLMNAKNNGFQ